MASNEKAARLFEETADYMEIAGANPFRVRAYRNAAEKIRGLAEPIESLAESGELEKIDGIGEKIAQKIRTIIKDGDFPDHKEIAEKYPASLLQMLDIEGLGPKRVGRIYKEFGVQTLDELKELAESGKLLQLEGFGEKFVAKIKSGLESLATRSGRFRLDTARHVADKIVEELRKIDGVIAEPAGSVRRWRESVHDVDVIAAGPENRRDDVMKAFLEHRDVDEVIQKGETKSSVRMDNNLRVDLRYVKTDEFGAAIQYFTGSKAHNVKLRGMAKAKKLKISEYGLFDVSGKAEKKIAGKTEESIYEELGLSWIPPELREDTGEIEAAMDGGLPNLIELGDIRGDLHMHTTESDGKNSLSEMIDAARERGYKFIAITDHSKAVTVANGLDEKRLEKWIKKIHEENKKHDDIEVLAGIEVDIMKDGSLDLDEAVLKECDIVVASVHSNMRLSSLAMTARLVRALSSGLVNVLGHPTARLINSREPIEYDFDEVLSAGLENNVAFEINASPYRLDLSERLVRRVIEKGGRISINTDAHSIRGLDLMEYGVRMARRGWCEKKSCINTLTASQLRKWLS